MEVPDALGIIAGNGVYPRLLADAARRAGVKRIVAAAFTDETDDRLAAKVDEVRASLQSSVVSRQEEPSSPESTDLPGRMR